MDYKIEQSGYTESIIVDLNPGEHIYTQPGALIASRGDIKIEVETITKSLLQSFKSVFVGGESLFKNRIEAIQKAELVVGGVVGKIVKIDLDGSPLYINDGAYLAHIGEIEFNYELTGKGWDIIVKGLTTSAGFFIGKITGRGTIFLEAQGGVREYNLLPNEILLVDNMNFICTDIDWKEKTSIVSPNKGIKSSLLSGEGVFIKFVGPGKVWVNTRNIPGIYHSKDQQV
ncbi:MAG: AIM24 family protein [Candidatus Anstonellales archaeon]